jgi:hypothetical protein
MDVSLLCRFASSKTRRDAKVSSPIGDIVDDEYGEKSTPSLWCPARNMFHVKTYLSHALQEAVPIPLILLEISRQNGRKSRIRRT